MWVQLNCLCTCVGHFCSDYTNGVWPFYGLQCGTVEQAIYHNVLHGSIHRPAYGGHELTVLNDETIEWLLNTCPEILCSLAADKNLL